MKTQKINHQQLYDFIVKYIPELKKIQLKTLKIILPGKKKFAYVSGTLSGSNERIKYFLTKEGGRVFSDDFIEEIYRFIPSLKNIGITSIAIFVNTRNLVSASLKIEVNANLDTGLMYQYKLQSP